MSDLVSVIVTTKNSQNTLKAHLESIKHQSYKKIEIVVVDNYSSDKTLKVAKKYTKFVYQMGPERSVQRNFGSKKAHGKYLFHPDSDMILGKDVVKQCVELMQREKLGAIVIPEKSFGIGFWAKVKTFEREINEGEEYFEAARFFPAKLFWEMKGYDETLTGPEDWDLPQRIGLKHKIGRIKEYIDHNEGKTSIINLVKKKYYYGLSVNRYLKKQKMSIISPKTVYFLRSAYYKKWPKLFVHPILTFGMILMLTLESFGGGFGYLKGRFKDE